MKKILISTVLSILLVISPANVFASSSVLENNTDVAFLENENYYETIIESEETIIDNEMSPSDVIQSFLNNSVSTKTKSKTTSYKNSSGAVMWYVKVTGTFTYGNGTAKCIYSTVTASSKNSSWKVSKKSASKSGNKASASATGTHYFKSIAGESITKKVTLTCSPSGNFS